ncbi:hypothetical protein O1611_g5364 [Lasiodiplodia mahajangana]|uniref:Uncharacterized protein n=1 Tax=Lasiodiplodia mahajangana TaxID=1108764 RepID=A0ACC2JLA3_9PEZI|nr:hypothetical protein O1611_g5364 [Lasiodiplodia mahajangana]
MSTRKALIVGANRGIGLNLVRALSLRAWDVTGTIRPEAFGDSSFEDLKQTGAAILSLDLLDENSIKAAVAEYGPGPLDVLVNCAGIGPEPDEWYEHTAEILMEKYRTNTVGQDLAYRLSKTALNQLTATMAAEFKNNGDGISVMAVYPGYLATRLSSFRSRDNMEESIEGIARIIETAGMDKTGSFLNWKGEVIPW